MPALKADLDLLEKVARAAGEIARRYVSGDNPFHAKADGSPVSDADLAVNSYLQQALQAARPDYGWLSEESADDQARLSTKRIFIVDPIDGTSALIAHKPEFTIAIGIVEDHQSIAGVVYNPLTEECFLAAKGLGATLNGQKMHVSALETLSGARVLMRMHLARRGGRGPWPEMHAEERCSAAYRLVLAAAGIFDAAICLTAKREWDLAAADIIVREAGGEVVTCDGKPLLYNCENVRIPSVVAASPALIRDILPRTRTSKAS